MTPLHVPWIETNLHHQNRINRYLPTFPQPALDTSMTIVISLRISEVNKLVQWEMRNVSWKMLDFWCGLKHCLWSWLRCQLPSNHQPIGEPWFPPVGSHQFSWAFSILFFSLLHYFKCMWFFTLYNKECDSTLFWIDCDILSPAASFQFVSDVMLWSDSETRLHFAFFLR